MSNVKKLMMTAAGGGEALNVEDVFSTYLYKGTGGSLGISNGIALADGVGGGTSTEFDGNSDYLLRTTDLSNTQGSKTFTVSFWVYDNIGKKGTSRAIYYIFDGSTYYSFQVYFLSTNGYLSIRGRNSSGTLILNQSITTPVRKKDQWLHVLMSFDLSDVSKRHYSVNDVVGTPSNTTYTNDTIAFTNGSPQHSIAGSFTGSTLHDGNLAHFYMDYTYRDLTVASNRRLFIDANGGSTSPSTLSALNPVIYLPMTDGYSVGENIGTGGDLTAYGSPSIVNNGTEYLSGYGQGGLVWTKFRTNTVDHILFDTERGALQKISSNTTAASANDNNTLTSFNSDGFSLGNRSLVNQSGQDFASWTFRKAPKFFDVVTYTGNGTNPHVISHNLGSTPGMVITFELSGAVHRTWHRSLGNNAYINLDGDAAAGSSSQVFQTANSTTFTLGASGSINENGKDYVAYLFAHNDGDGGFGPTGDQDIIKCGSYTGNGSSTGPEIDLGWEPQYLMVKRTDGTGPWYCVDNMRGFDRYRDNAYLYLNANNSEFSDYELFRLHPTGFQPRQNFGVINANGGSYMYMAIRRGPMGIPTNAEDVFSTGDLANTSTVTNTGIVTDMYMHKALGTESWYLGDRFSGRTLQPNQKGAQFNTLNEFDHMDGFKQEQTNSTSVYWAWKRAAGFFDALVYTGNGSHPQTINHNLGVVPEMIWHKCRTGYGSGDWAVYHKDTYPNGGSLNNGGGIDYFGQFYNNIDSTPTATTIDVKNITYDSEGSNYSGYTYAMFLFASVPGVSKVGSYTGNSSTQTIDCGFTNGARFVMIKSSTLNNTEWMVFDSHRGILAGNDPLLEISTTDGNTITTDWIDPANSGFIVNALGDINSNGETYIFYAIA